MKVLVSLTNKFGKSKLFPEICLLEVDSCTGNIKPIEISHPRIPSPLTGVGGLTFYQDSILFFADGCMVGQLNKDYKVINAWPVPIEQAHSIIYVDGKLYTAATNNDCIIESTPFKDRHTTYWEDNPNRKDTIHVNSVAHCCNSFYVTAFGPRKDFWHSAESGYIKNITTGEIIEQNLKQPHTLCNVNNELYYCNSATSEVCKYRSTKRLKVDSYSYVRGLAFTKKYLAVATSKGRTKSKSTGKDLVSNFTDPGNPCGHCAIHFYRRAATLDEYKHITTINLDDYGSEIFDLLPLDNFLKEPNLLRKSFNWFKESFT